ncbi:MAG: hypothetical protein ABL901_00735 [Hyphomicrobiaceae bacterium]
MPPRPRLAFPLEGWGGGVTARFCFWRRRGGFACEVVEVRFVRDVGEVGEVGFARDIGEAGDFMGGTP